ncbi:MAG: DUF503 domain-containing protein [Defluviitaleaceae bacterium]|nr:DUF503 domain-containing protein [Defluviitaleaceae bacterium]
MYVKAAKLTFRVEWAQSLKDKRQVRRSLVDKTRQKFNASVAEVGATESHQTLVIGICMVSGDLNHAGQSLDEIIRFMEDEVETNGLAELLEIRKGVELWDD